MGLQALYERFLQSPNPLNLADDATLQYVTTLQSFSQQGRIMKHLDDQDRNIVKKKAQKVISAVEGLTSVAIIVDTTLEFQTAGGAYLPGLDTFIVDRTATLPVTHFVHFDKDDKITQIRLSWDQGDLLKQVEVIGARGKNWPVYGGKEQIKMITTSTSTANQVNPAPSLSPRGRNRGDANGAERSASPSKKYIQDPHKSLDIFNQEQEQRVKSAPNAVAPRESHKPEPRDMSDIFAAGHEDYQPAVPGGSPRKDSNVNVVAPKGAGHKRFQPSEVFASEEPLPAEPKIYKTNPARYNHFDIGDHDDQDSFQHRTTNEKAQDMPIRPKGGKVTQHTSQWGFADYATPEKSRQQKVRGQDVVHFNYGDEENTQTKKDNRPLRKDNDAHFDFQDSGTPVMRQTHAQPRKDIDNHFNFSDESTPAGRRIIARTKAAAGLYRDPVFGAEEDDRPLAKTSNNARKDLASHWDHTDDATSNSKPGNRGQARKGLESQWGLGDENNAAPKQQPVGRARKQDEKGFWDF